MRINWGDVKLHCPQCGRKDVSVMMIYIECWTCHWYRKREEFR